MRRLMQILGILLAIALLWAVARGLGLTRTFKHRKDVKNTKIIDDFEYQRDDFDWNTGGYAKIEPSTENQTHGKQCAKVSFYTTQQFFPTPVPGVDPMNSSQVLYSAAGKVLWRPEIILDTNSVTQLPVFEWQDYADLKMDVFNDQAQPVSYYIQIADSKAFVYETTGILAPKKVTNIDVPLDDLIKTRLDLTNIRSFKFAVNMAGVPEPMVAYVDYLRLDGDASTPLSKKAVNKK